MISLFTQGQELVRGLPGNAVLLGEMGIGNSAAALLMARLGALDIGEFTGAGTGLDAAGVTRKTEVLRVALQRCVFAHRSGERGHARMLQLLDATPLLDLGLPLGEGFGAALARPLLQSACLLLAEMVSFESAGVAGQSPAILPSRCESRTVH